MESRKCFFHIKIFVMKFEKMHAAGNDYVYVNLFEENVDNPAALSRKISNRNFGVGSDGLVLIGPSENGDFYMHMFNADGSEGMMCGNAARCVGKYVYERELTDKTEIDLETRSGLKHLSLKVNNHSNNVELVRVNMGRALITSDNKGPMDFFQLSLNRMIDYPVQFEEHKYRITFISMGNPHAVIFMNDISRLDIKKIGARIEHLEHFPERTNVEFVEVVNSKQLNIRVWERGSGETLACGSGACAAVVAGAITGRCKPKASVRLKGGTLEVDWDKNGDRVYLTGDAHFVFKGEFLK